MCVPFIRPKSQAFKNEKSTPVDNAGATPRCVVIILKSVSPAALELHVSARPGSGTEPGPQ